MTQPWTPEEIAMLGKIPDKEMAKRTGRTLSSCRQKRQAHGLGATPALRKAEADKPYEADKEQSGQGVWKKKYSDLLTKYQRALHESAVVDQLVGDIKDLAPTSYSALPPVTSTRIRGQGTKQSAVLLLSDTHVGKVVLPSQTLNFGSYNFRVFLARLKFLEESIVSILKNHTTVGIEELVIPMLGDMLDGSLLHGVEAGQHNTLFSQYYGAGHALAQFLRVLASHVPAIRVETVVGNHTRWQNQKRMPTENRYSNLDMFLYAYLEALTRDIPNIHWNLNAQPFALFQVQGWTFHGSHGDHLRGGDKALGIPNHAIGRELSTKTQLFTKHARQAPHYYVSGHLHREIQLPHALGDVTINGGFPGLDNYSLAENFNPVDPTQCFFFIHPKYGKTASYTLNLKFAEVASKVPYTIPSAFPIE